MKRSVGVLAGLTLAMLVGPAPVADAVGVGACTVTGTIRLSPEPKVPGRGTWEILPATILCRGQFNTKELMLKHGAFTGAGSYRDLPSGEGGCLQELGTGTVDYWIPTEKQDVHIIEPYSFVLAGAGVFTTPTLRGSFQMAHDGNCLTSPSTKALFLAETTLVRVSVADFTP